MIFKQAVGVERGWLSSNNGEWATTPSRFRGTWEFKALSYIYPDMLISTALDLLLYKGSLELKIQPLKFYYSYN